MVSTALLLGEVHKVLLARYRNNDNAAEVDALSWMIITLGESGNSAYKSTLAKIAMDSSAHTKVKKFARKYYRKM